MPSARAASSRARSAAIDAHVARGSRSPGGGRRGLGCARTAARRRGRAKETLSESPTINCGIHTDSRGSIGREDLVWQKSGVERPAGHVPPGSRRDFFPNRDCVRAVTETKRHGDGPRHARGGRRPVARGCGARVLHPGTIRNPARSRDRLAIGVNHFNRQPHSSPCVTRAYTLTLAGDRIRHRASAE